MSEYFQDKIPANHCYGCGPLNHQGLQIKSRWREQDQAECLFQPSPEHSAGPLQYLNGGIIATIIDCHSICTAIAKCYQLEGREIGEGENIWCVTGKMELKYLRPVLISQPVTLVASIAGIDGNKLSLDCELHSQDELCVKAQVLAVRVPLSWLEAQLDKSLNTQ